MARETGAPEADETHVTPEMIEVGAVVILECVGGCDLGGYFSAQRLAEEVYRAMATFRKSGEPTAGLSSPQHGS